MNNEWKMVPVDLLRRLIAATKLARGHGSPTQLQAELILKAPVPPAGHVEVPRYDMSGFGDGMIEIAGGAFVYFDDHLAHFTRLTAERDGLLADVKRLELHSHCHLQRAKISEAELTKARELFEDMLRDDDMPVHWFAQRISEVTDAPAAKGGE